MKVRLGKVAFGALTVILFSFRSPLCSADDFGSWHGVSVKTLDSKFVNLISSAQLRFDDDSSKLRQYKLTEMIVIKAGRNFGVGVNYTYLPTRSVATGAFVDQHRIELEVIPRLPVTQWLMLEFRQRLELRWLEGQSGSNERSRHAVQATWTLAGPGPLTAVYASDELFYDYGRDQMSENRLVPLGLRFKVNSKVGVAAYYMLRSTRSGDAWQQSHILGTQWSLSF